MGAEKRISMNPLNSPWYKPPKAKKTFISDTSLYFRWKPIAKHLTSNPEVNDYNGILSIQTPTTHFYIAKNSSKMRLRSHLDWCWYTPKTLAQAIDNDTVESYYEIMLNDMRSDPNEWKDTDLELQLKSFYAARIGRASLL